MGRRLSNEEEQFIRIKHLAYCSSNPAVQIGAIDTLAAYGEHGVDAINEVVNLSDISDRVRKYGLQTIGNIKKTSIQLVISDNIEFL